jgi:hypothetical protein
VCSCEIDCPPIDPTPSPSELAIRSRLRWRAAAIACNAVMAAGMRTGDKTIKTNMAIENMHVLSFLRKADRLIFVKRVLEHPPKFPRNEDSDEAPVKLLLPSCCVSFERLPSGMFTLVRLPFRIAPEFCFLQQ